MEPVAKRREELKAVSNRRGRMSAARANIIRSLSEGLVTNRFSLYKKNKEVI